MRETDGLDKRSLRIIKILIDEYMRSGEPVGSATLASKSGIKLSPASIRNVMAGLESQGYIEPVHTSSGRRPTTKGFRVYLGSLVRMRSPTAKEREQLADRLRTDSTNGMAKSAMQSMAQLTKMISLVSIPGASESKLKHINFVELSSARVMVVLVTVEGEVRNRLIETEESMSQKELVEAAAFFNEKFAGHTLASAKIELGGLVSGLQRRIAVLLSKMLATITDQDGNGRKVYMSGPENLLAHQEMTQDADKLQDMVNLLHRKETLLGMLDKGSAAQDVSVFIGSESGVPELEEFSLITSPYADDQGKVIGALGLIGPIRMRYGRILPIIELTSELMSQAMGKIRKGLN